MHPTAPTSPASAPPSSPSRGEPVPIAGRGYHLVFRDRFDRLDRSVWDDHIWYDGPPKPSWKGFQSVEDGVLHLRTSRKFVWNGTSCSGDQPDNCNWPINTITTLKSRSFRQGYFEARMRWTGAPGAWPGFWLISNRHAANEAWPSVNPYCGEHGLPSALCLSAELDVFEGQGSTPDVFYGTLHRNSSGDYGVADRQNASNEHPVDVDLAAGWHMYSALWTASSITWYLDGRPLMSAPTYDSTNQPMFLVLSMWVGGWTRDPGASTPDVLETEVDEVSVWQK